MSASWRRALWLLLIPLLLVIACGVSLVSGIHSFIRSLSGSPSVQYDQPTQLASVSLPSRANSLAWSADGSYLAAGTWGPPTEQPGPSNVYVVDVATASLKKTLDVTGWVEGLGFSPDGKWLAVATRQTVPAAATPAELVVFDIPAFTVKFTAKSIGAENAFIDIAWAPDSKSLHAIDGQETPTDKAEVRRWDVPTFTEQPAIPVPEGVTYKAIAVAVPDDLTVGIDEQAPSGARVIRLLNLTKGTAATTFKVGNDFQAPRLGFTPDGKAIGIFAAQELSWWDRSTGKSAKPDPARFLIQPASLSHIRGTDFMTLDGNYQAHGHERHRGFGDLGWDNRDNEFGGFVEVTARSPAKTWTWRVSRANDAPPVVFSPDGTKLAGVVTEGTSASILIWAVPK